MFNYSKLLGLVVLATVMSGSSTVTAQSDQFTYLKCAKKHNYTGEYFGVLDYNWRLGNASISVWLPEGKYWLDFCREKDFQCEITEQFYKATYTKTDAKRDNYKFFRNTGELEIVGEISGVPNRVQRAVCVVTTPPAEPVKMF